MESSASKQGPSPTGTRRKDNDDNRKPFKRLARWLTGEALVSKPDDLRLLHRPTWEKDTVPSDCPLTSTDTRGHTCMHAHVNMMQ